MADIKPALTAEEWVAERKRMGVDGEIEEVALDDEGGCFMVSNNPFETMGLTHPDMLAAAIALANAALPDGDPRKLTWDDVDMLRETTAGFMTKQEHPETGGGHMARVLDSLADKIAALLPPRE